MSPARNNEATSALPSEPAMCPSLRDTESLKPLISVIEDDAPLRALLVEWLTADGYRVDVGAPAGVPDAGTSATSEQAKAQFLIVDLFMPRAHGIERLRLARRAHPNVPIIAISGQFIPSVDAAGAAAVALNVDRVVAKPFERKVILDAVRSLIGKPG